MQRNMNRGLVGMDNVDAVDCVSMWNFMKDRDEQWRKWMDKCNWTTININKQTNN